MLLELGQVGCVSPSGHYAAGGRPLQLSDLAGLEGRESSQQRQDFNRFIMLAALAAWPYIERGTLL